MCGYKRLFSYVCLSLTQTHMSAPQQQKSPSMRTHSESGANDVANGGGLSFSVGGGAGLPPSQPPFRLSASFTFGEGGARERWKNQWKSAAFKARLLQDPWARLSLDQIPEVCLFM